MGKSSDTTLMVKFQGEVDSSLTAATSKVEGELNRSGQSVTETSKKHKNVMVGLAAGLGSAAGTMIGSGLVKAVDFVADSFKRSIEGAGTLQQSIGAVDTVFKGNADQMHKWASTAAEDVGMTRNEFNELGTLIGTQLKNGGTAMAQLGPKTKDLITLGADLSSMFGGTSREAVEALSSALKGERDPIEKYGVSLNQAKIDAEAAALGFKKVGGSLSTEAQQAATLSLIMKQTADAHGNFGKEADTLQGKQQRLNAKWEDFTTKIGMYALPVITDLMGGLSGLVDWLAPVGDGLDGIVSIITKGDFKGADLTFGLEEDDPIVGILFDIHDGLAQIGDFMMGVGKILFQGDFDGGLLGLEEDDPIIDLLFNIREGVIAVGDALGGFINGMMMSGDEVGEFGGTLTLAQQIGAEFRSGLEKIGAAFIGWFEVMRPIAMQVYGLLVQKWAEMGPAVSTIFESIRAVVANVMVAVEAIIRIATGILSKVWETWGPGILKIISSIWDAVVGVFKGAFKIIEGISDVFAGMLTGDTSKMMTGVHKIFEGAFSGIQSLFRGAVGVLGGIWDGIKATFAGPVNWVISNVLNPLLKKINEIAGFFGLKLNLPQISLMGAGAGSGGGGHRGSSLAMADGGIMPGYTPGRDVHRFWSPTAGVLELSGGEPVLRPEAGVALGAGWVHGINRAARMGGVAGVRSYLGGFAGGGIIPNARQGFGGYDPKALAAMQAWAAATGIRWSMTGNGGARTFADQKRAWDLYQSGQGPLAANPWRGGPHMIPAIAMDLSPRPGQIPSAAALLPRFGLGLTVRGEPWHVGYLGGRGGGQTAGGGGGFGFDPLGMLKSAVGAFAKVSGGGVLGEILNAVPGKLMDYAGDWLTGQFKFDSGGWLQPGRTAVVNETGRPEAVLTADQWDAIRDAAAGRDNTEVVALLRELIGVLREAPLGHIDITAESSDDARILAEFAQLARRRRRVEVA